MLCKPTNQGSIPPAFPSMDPPAADSSAASSPRSRPDAWDVEQPKVRVMCSYGGHIIPRPHDKSLCYVGGDTRIVVLDRQCSLADLLSRLSHTLLNGRHFSLKYQLPSEDLDSLISLATDEDLDNMIDEYDRLKPPPRLRLFLFPSKPDTAASMGSLLDDAKSETWFVDALNGSGLLLPRGLSDSAALLEVDRGMANTKIAPSPPVVETSSSSGSSSSSMANLPPIKVRAEEYLMDEQFSSHMSIAPPPVSVKSGSCGGDDARSEKSDHGTVAPTGLRKPPLPLPLQPVQRKLVDVHNLPSPDSKHATAYSLPSPDSVASIASGGSVTKHANAMYPDQNRVINNTPNQNDPKMMQEPPQQQQQQQQQFIPAPGTTHYMNIQHHTPMQPVPSYYPVYLHHQTQTQTQHADPQYPMYLTSYDASTRSLTPPKPDMAPHQFQHHYIGVPQMQPAPPGFEYSHHMQDQAYYAPPPPQYQTITPAAAVMFSQVSTPDANHQHS